MRMLPFGLDAMPNRAVSRSWRTLSTSPEPWPPSVNDERTTSG